MKKVKVEVYKKKDLIIGHVRLPDPCPVKVVVTDEEVFLYVGPRDWQWNRKTGKFVGAGTAVCGPVGAVCHSGKDGEMVAEGLCLE